MNSDCRGGEYTNCIDYRLSPAREPAVRLDVECQILNTKCQLPIVHCGAASGRAMLVPDYERLQK